DITGDNRNEIIIKSAGDTYILEKVAIEPGHYGALIRLKTYDEFLSVTNQKRNTLVFFDPYAITKAEVTISSKSGTYKTKTDMHGNFKFANIPSGTYAISAKYGSYNIVPKDNVSQ